MISNYNNINTYYNNINIYYNNINTYYNSIQYINLKYLNIFTSKYFIFNKINNNTIKTINIDINYIYSCILKYDFMYNITTYKIWNKYDNLLNLNIIYQLMLNIQIYNFYTCSKLIKYII